MIRVKIRLDELYPHFVIVVPGENPETDEFENFETDMHKIDEDTLGRLQAAYAVFYAARAELRALYESHHKRPRR